MISTLNRGGLSRRLIAITIVGGMGLVACGDDDDAGDSADTGTEETTAESPAGAADTTAPSDTTAGGGSGTGEEVAGGEEVEITFLTNNDPANVTTAEAVIAAFESAHPNVTVQLDTRPGGAEGDNLVKTRLATGDMADVFEYNSGSLFQALGPETNLQPVTDQPFVADLEPEFADVVSAGEDVYGAPWGTFVGGGVLYNKPIYEELGLEVPTTWDEFMANNAAVAEAGSAAPVEQTYGDTWTSQLFVLADYHNVQVANPTFAEDYTNNQAKYATTPAALRGFEHLQEVNEADLLNEDFASATFVDGVAAVGTGAAAHYPMLTFAAGALAQSAPDNVDDVGFFAQPGDDPKAVGMTLWVPSGLYIPNGVEGAKLEAVHAFQSFLASPEGCEAQVGAVPVGGPFAVTTCDLPADVLPMVEDVASYVDSGAVTPALEFLSPIKGPALEQITVEVGSGIRGAEEGAALYDEDVKKQAQQLGLEGW